MMPDYIKLDKGMNVYNLTEFKSCKKNVSLGTKIFNKENRLLIKGQEISSHCQGELQVILI